MRSESEPHLFDLGNTGNTLPAAPSVPQGGTAATSNPVSGIAARIAKTSRANPIGAIAIFVLLAILAVILLGPILPIPDPQHTALMDRLQDPLTHGQDGTLHVFGTDQLGRDVLSRTVHGGRISLGIALTSVIISGVIGTFLGLIAGYRGGPVDYIVMRLVDFQMAMPSLLLAIFLIYMVGPSLLNLVILLSIMIS